MKVVIREGVEVKLGNNGIVLYIADNAGAHVGKLRIGQATVEWCRGRTRLGNGHAMPLQSFIQDHLERM